MKMVATANIAIRVRICFCSISTLAVVIAGSKKSALLCDRILKNQDRCKKHTEFRRAPSERINAPLPES
jgi:hypothetical protein